MGQAPDAGECSVADPVAWSASAAAGTLATLVAKERERLARSRCAGKHHLIRATVVPCVRANTWRHRKGEVTTGDGGDHPPRLRIIEVGHPA
jgi:hypothetical protein